MFSPTHPSFSRFFSFFTHSSPPHYFTPLIQLAIIYLLITSLSLIVTFLLIRCPFPFRFAFLFFIVLSFDSFTLFIIRCFKSLVTNPCLENDFANMFWIWRQQKWNSFMASPSPMLIFPRCCCCLHLKNRLISLCFFGSLSPLVIFGKNQEGDRLPPPHLAHYTLI